MFLKTDNLVFSAIPHITGVVEAELVKQIIAKVREIMTIKNSWAIEIGWHFLPADFF